MPTTVAELHRHTMQQPWHITGVRFGAGTHNSTNQAAPAATECMWFSLHSPAYIASDPSSVFHCSKIHLSSIYTCVSCIALAWFGLFGLTQLYCLCSAVSVHYIWPVCTAHAPTTMTSCQHQGHNATAKRVLFCDNRQAQSVCGAWHPGSSANICSAILCSLVYILGSGPVAGSRG